MPPPRKPPRHRWSALCVVAASALFLPAPAFAQVASPPGPAGYLALGLAMIFVVARLVEWLWEDDEGDDKSERRRDSSPLANDDGHG